MGSQCQEMCFRVKSTLQLAVMAQTKRGRHFHHTEGSTTSRHGFQIFICIYEAFKASIVDICVKTALKEIIDQQISAF